MCPEHHPFTPIAFLAKALELRPSIDPTLAATTQADSEPTPESQLTTAIFEEVMNRTVPLTSTYTLSQRDQADLRDLNHSPAEWIADQQRQEWAEMRRMETESEWFPTNANGDAGGEDAVDGGEEQAPGSYEERYWRNRGVAYYAEGEVVYYGDEAEAIRDMYTAQLEDNRLVMEYNRAVERHRHAIEDPRNLQQSQFWSPDDVQYILRQQREWFASHPEYAPRADDDGEEEETYMYTAQLEEGRRNMEQNMAAEEILQSQLWASAARINQQQQQRERLGAHPQDPSDADDDDGDTSSHTAVEDCRYESPDDLHQFWHYSLGEESTHAGSSEEQQYESDSTETVEPLEDESGSEGAPQVEPEDSEEASSERIRKRLEALGMGPLHVVR